MMRRMDRMKVRRERVSGDRCAKREIMSVREIERYMVETSNTSIYINRGTHFFSRKFS